MTDETGKKLPNPLVGFQDFKQFIEDKAPFVDKTAIISELIGLRGGTYFLSRPRRFGKTLLLDTIQNIFEGKRELFEGLDIVTKNLWGDWEPLPVISLSFSKYPEEPSAIRTRLITDLNTIARKNSLPIGKVTQVSEIALIIECLSDRQIAKSKAMGLKPDESSPKNVVLLVDEYDVPLLVNLESDEAIGEVRKLLHAFYISIKSCYKKLRFTLIAGITKFKQLSLYSGLNNVEDISLNHNYSAICGFTENEIRLHYRDYISETLNHLKEKKALGKNANDETLMAKILEWYDGYSWDGITMVLNPFSVASLFKEKHFDYYWYLSGAPLFTSLLTLKNDTYFKAFSKNFRIGNTLPLSDVHEINDEAALFQAGYLTIDSSDESSLKPQYILKVPNTEIGYAIVQEFVNKEGILNKSQETINSKYGSFVDAFDSRNEKECSAIFSSCLSEIASHLHLHAELTPQVMMYTMLNIKESRARMEENVGGGRIDLVYASPDKDVTIIEIKYKKPWKRISLQKKQEVIDNGVLMAFKQADDKRYALSYFSNERNVYVCAVSVYGSSDAIIRFKRKVYVDGQIRDAPLRSPATAPKDRKRRGS